MKKFLKYIFVVALLLFCMQTEAQRFFNLTATEVEVDTMLPHFGYSVPLEGRYQDSVYTVSIVYPDFVDMTIADITNYNRLSGAMLPELPVLTQRIVTDRKRASLEVSFCPLVFRNHRYQALAGFMLKVEAKALTRSIHRSQVLTRTGAAGAARSCRDAAGAAARRETGAQPADQRDVRAAGGNGTGVIGADQV